MLSKTKWKLLPLAALFAMALFLVGPGASLPRVSADISSLDVEDETIGDGESTTITFEADPEDGDISIQLTSVASTTDAVIEITDCGGCLEEDDFDDSSLTIDSDDSDFPEDGFIELTLTLDCTDVDTVRVNVSQGNTQTVEVTCDPDSTGSGNIIIRKEADGAASNLNFEFSITAPGSRDCEDSSFLLSDGESESFDCENGVYTIEEISMPAGWDLTDISCTRGGGVTLSDLTIDLDNNRLTIEIEADNDELDCTFTNKLTGTATPTPTGTPAAVAQVQVQAVPNAVNCNGSSFITVVVKTATGANADNVLVNVSTTLGTVSPTQATTSNGSILTIFTAPSNSGGTATITATSGNQTGTATITVNCSSTPPTATPAPIPPTVVPGPIQPPNTGDAGLAGQGGRAWWPFAMIVAALLSGSLVAMVAAVRRRS